MKFKVSTSKDAVAETSGSSYINTSGLYPVTIDFASISTSKNGAQSINFNVDYNGNKQTFYSQTLVNTDGQTNEIGLKFLNKLAIIAGLEEGDELDIEEEEHTVGKDNKPQTFAVIQQFSGLEVIMHIQMEYYKYNGEIKERHNIRSIFRSDKATAEEIVDGENFGKRYAETEAKYADKTSYKDGLTAEDIAEWKANKSKKSDTPAPTAKKAATGGLFGKK